MKKIVLVRHGLSVSNAGHHWADGPSSIPLTAEGERLAQAMANNWEAPTPDLICCSTYTRSMQTAAPLATKFALPLQTLDFIHEFTFWDFNWTPEEYASKRAEASAYWLRLDPNEKAGGPNAESFLECIERCRRFRDWAVQTEFETCVCISHGHFMHFFRAVMGGLDVNLSPREFMVYLRDSLPGRAYGNLEREEYLLPINDQASIDRRHA